jgi:hypothetical protein
MEKLPVVRAAFFMLAGFTQKRKGGVQRLQREELNRKDRNRDAKGAKKYAFSVASFTLLCAFA